MTSSAVSPTRWSGENVPFNGGSQEHAALRAAAKLRGCHGNGAETLALAMQHHQAGELQTAAQLYRQVLQEYPDHAETRYRLASICLALGWLTEAVENYQKLLPLAERACRAWRPRNCFRPDSAGWRRRLPVSAKHELEDPYYADAYNNLGLVLVKQGRIDEAVANHRYSLHLKPDNPLAYNNLGNVLRDLGQLDEALDCYREALRLNPGCCGGLSSEGSLTPSRASSRTRPVVFRRLSRLRPDYAKAHSNLGNALRNLGAGRFLSLLSGSMRLEPDYAEAHDDYGRSGGGGRPIEGSPGQL